MKFFKKLILVISILFSSNATFAQNQYKDWLSIFADVTQVFGNWITGTEHLASTQDKNKLSDISKDIYRNLDRIILTKRSIIRKISDSSHTNYENLINDCINRVKDLQTSLDKSEDLCNAIGLEAIKFSDKLSFYFADKELMLTEILENPNKKITVLENLNKGIILLEEAKAKIDQLITQLEKK